ncbi:MAG: DUF4329 domain-containing protein [Gammaproteobacteria bacterium]|nr:DUF4329 domain-containing protein [Gammaproteobacteria bacterium]
MSTRAPIRYILIASMLLLSILSFANSSISRQTAFDSEQQAVAAATDIYNPLSIKEDREFMGVILRRNDKYFFTVTAGTKGNDTVTIRIPRSSWDNVVAFWHTHGRAEYKNQYFSEIDTSLANSTGKPFYLADYTGALKVFRPGGKTLSQRQATSLGLPRQSGFARGSQVHGEKNQIVLVNTLFNSSLRLSQRVNRY